MKKLSKKEWIASLLAVVFVAYALFGGEIMSLFKGTMSENTTSQSAGLGNAPTGVVINDVKVGTGREVKQGDVLSVHYILSLQDGTVIQNSKDFGTPFQFVLGAGQVIQGWEQGFAGMKVGGTRTMAIPPELGYGESQAGPIPPNSTLIFTVELLDAQDSAGVQAQ